MIYENKPVVFAVPNDQKITVYSSETNDMVQFYKQEPTTFIEKIKAKIDPTPKYDTITGDKIDEVLQDDSANVVDISRPGVVNIAFINEDNTVTNGAAINLITTQKHTNDSGFWINGISQNKLNEYVLNNGVCQFDHSQHKVTEEEFDSTPYESNP